MTEREHRAREARIRALAQNLAGRSAGTQKIMDIVWTYTESFRR